MTNLNEIKEYSNSYEQKPLQDEVDIDGRKFNLNSSCRISLKDGIEMQEMRMKGVIMRTTLDKTTEIINMNVLVANESKIAVELVKRFYGLNDNDIDTLAFTDLRKLYAPIEVIDPLGFEAEKKEQAQKV